MPSPTARRSPIDPFFEVVPDGQWNACVGQQGTSLNYVDGYLEAARELIAAVIDKRLMGSRDTLAMPILYNCRHGLELALKFAIDRLHRMGMLPASHPINHDILSHWAHLNAGPIGDRAIRRLIAELEPFVRSLASIDEDGQELRYAVNRAGGRSLDGIAVVNLPLIRASITVLSAILERIKLRLFDLEAERATGTYTAECSRADLEDIARSLGNHAGWREPAFAETKRRMMERYDLGSRKFAKAVDAIKASRQLAVLIGFEATLDHLSDEKAVATLHLWSIAHPVPKPASDDLGLDYFDRKGFEEHAQATRALNDGISALLSPDEFADLQALFYIGRDRVFGEHYGEMLRDAKAEPSGPERRWATVHHLMSKTNLLEEVEKGLRAVGRPSLAATLRELHAERFANLESEGG